MNFGLERMHQLLHHLNNPQERLAAIHVAGTNGKGSVCAYLTSVLLQAEYKVGRFNSPHLLAPHDSVQINGKPVDPSRFETAKHRVASISNENQLGATGFEILVATALMLFDQAQGGLDVIVVEVGLGGLLDATNVFTSPAMTIITSIGLDHTGILGNSIEEIACAKAGIMKQRCPVVIAPQAEHAAMATLVERARILDITCVLVDSSTMRNTCNDSSDSNNSSQHQQQLRLRTSPKDTKSGAALFTIDIDYAVTLQGDYQRGNSATAIIALELLTHLGTFRISKQAIQQGMASAKWPGRLDWVDTVQLSAEKMTTRLPFSRILVDGAHNPPACRELRRYIDQVLLQRHCKRVIWLIGVTQGKSLKDMLATLTRPEDLILTLPFSQPEGMPWIHCVDPVTLAQQAADDKNQQQITPQHSLNSALDTAASLFNVETDIVVLCGSLYLVADLYRLTNTSPF